MSNSIAQATCRIHFDRPASARCPGCKQFYCLECITEHDGKLTCASCLENDRQEALGAAEETVEKDRAGLVWFQPMPIVHFLVGLIVIWVIFYFVAQTLTQIPDRFHDGTIWHR